MPSAADRIDFSPPPPRGSIRAFGLALLAHIMLIAALTWGVNWKKSDDSSAPFAAELWTSVPQQEAVPAQPVPQPPVPTPPVAPPKVVETPVTPDVDIALEQEKKRKQEREQKLAAEKAAKDKARLQAEAEEARAERIAKAEKAKADAKKAQQAKELAAAKIAADAKKLQAQKDAKDAQTKQADAKAADKLRQENLKRMQGMAGATDGNSTSKASSGGRGSSTTYGAIVRAAVRPNVVFTQDFVGNPLAKVEVRLTLDGTIISQRIVQSSGNKAWDDAALNALIRTRVMPRDVDGRIPDTFLIIEMTPRS